ncbi:MAG: EamA/RhaT family transporter [Burkholderiales bacterium]|nr:EamA/RhaT family transporter [Burkholderiales bacterium]
MWIPITIFAALAQTIRNAAQRSLVGELGTLGATLVRFLYGLPFAIAWLGLLLALTALPLPAFDSRFLVWTAVGGISQIAGTALLLRVMAARNFAVGVAYSKTDVVQTALFSALLLADALSLQGALAVGCATLGVLLLAPVAGQRPWRSLVAGFASRSAVLGLGCGACMALASVAFRAATHALASPSFLVAAAVTLVAALALQTVVLGGWLYVRDRRVVVRTLAAWRPSLFAGLMGAAASAGWFTAFAIKPATHVRTLGLVEIVFSYAVSRRFFREHLTRRELAALVLLGAGALLITTAA